MCLDEFLNLLERHILKSYLKKKMCLDNFLRSLPLKCQLNDFSLRRANTKLGSTLDPISPGPWKDRYFNLSISSITT